MRIEFRAPLIALLMSLAMIEPAAAQLAQIREAPALAFPAQSDSNSPAFWSSDQLVVYNSTGMGPVRSTGANQSELGRPAPVILGPSNHHPYWIEATWVDSDGSVLAWYHHEPAGLCGGSRLTAPQIGALLSRDGGRSFIDLGIVLESGYLLDCSARNGYFAGGHGDFTVILNRNKTYFYFLFTNYSGPLDAQGIVVARMPFDRRYNPVYAVQKWFQRSWSEPGLGGRVSAVFPAKVSWSSAVADSFWGPSIHYNKYLDKFVMLLNHSCCDEGWPQEGIYLSYNAALSNPAGWSEPAKLMDQVWWYPQILGTGPGGTDKLGGRVVRLWVYGESHWEIMFDKQEELPQQ